MDFRLVITVIEGVACATFALQGSMEVRKCVKTIHNYQGPKMNDKAIQLFTFTFQSRPSNIQALVGSFVFICVEFE